MALDRDEALRRSRAKAEEAGRDLGAYGDPVAERDDGGWLVRFEARDPGPGRHFTVAVDGETGEAKLWPGR